MIESSNTWPIADAMLVNTSANLSFMFAAPICTRQPTDRTLGVEATHGENWVEVLWNPSTIAKNLLDPPADFQDLRKISMIQYS